jgi:hypothetical protein
MYEIEDYRNAPSGLGPLADEWKDKPHRLVYDLCKRLEQSDQMTRYVYQLQVRGTDWLTGSHPRVITSTTVFTTREKADARVEYFKRACVGLLEMPVVTVNELEVVE